MRHNLKYLFPQLASIGGSAVLSFGSTLVFEPAERSRLGVFLVLAAIISNASCLGINYEIFRLSAAGQFSAALKVYLRFWPKQLGLSLLFCIAFDLYLFINHRLEWESSIILALTTVILGTSIQLSWLLLGAGKFGWVTALKGLAPACATIALVVFYLVNNYQAMLNATQVSYAIACAAVVLILWRGSKSLPRKAESTSEIHKPLSDHIWTYVCQTLLQVSGKLVILVGAALADPKWLGIASVGLAISEISLNFMQIAGAQSLKEFSTIRDKASYTKGLRLNTSALLFGLTLVIIATFFANFIIGGTYQEIGVSVGMFTLGIVANVVIVNAFNFCIASKDLMFPNLIMSLLILAGSTLMALTFLFHLADLAILIWVGCQWVLAICLDQRVRTRQRSISI